MPGDDAFTGKRSGPVAEPGSAPPPYVWGICYGARPAEPFPKNCYLCRLHGGGRPALKLDPAKPKPKPAPKPKRQRDPTSAGARRGVTTTVRSRAGDGAVRAAAQGVPRRASSCSRAAAAAHES